jgi:hypothetical protein
LQERTDARDRRARFWQNARKHMPNMEHARPRLEFDLTAHCSQALGHSDRIIAQCLVAADMNESRWQARPRQCVAPLSLLSAMMSM